MNSEWALSLQYSLYSWNWRATQCQCSNSSPAPTHTVEGFFQISLNNHAKVSKKDDLLQYNSENKNCYSKICIVIIRGCFSSLSNTLRVCLALIRLTGECRKEIERVICSCVVQSDICKWHLWCDGHWPTGLKYAWPEDVILQISLTKWSWSFAKLMLYTVLTNSSYTMILGEWQIGGKCYYYPFPLPCSCPNHPLQTHPRTETQRKRETKRARVKERSLQSDHSGYFPRVLLVTMEIWKIAPAV